MLRKHVTNPFVWVIVTSLAVSWSWLFTVRIAELSSSMIVGYLCMCFGFLVIITIATLCYAWVAIHFSERYKRQNKPGWQFLAQLFFAMAVVGWLVSILTAIVWIGRGGSWDTVLPFSSLTPAAMYTPLRFLARIVGFHGLTAWVVVLTLVCIGKKLRRFIPHVLGTTFVLFLFAWLPYRVPSGPVVKTTIVAEHLEDRAPAIHTDTDVVILPEYGLDGVAKSDVTSRISPTTDLPVFVVGSQRQPVDNGIQNTLMFGATHKGLIAEKPKSRLIPGGEYLPYGVELPLHWTGQTNTLQQFQLAEAINKGPYNAQPLVTNKAALGSAVCASILSTEDYRQFTQNGATILTNSASLAPFNSSLFLFQHQGMARFMATANARAFAQSTNSAPAFALDHNGRLLAKIQPVNTTNINLYANKKITPYTVLGEWPVYVGLAGGIWLILKHLVSSRRASTGAK